MLQSHAQSPDAPPLQQPLVQKITRGHSCVLCQQRKVKCDRQKPCSNCLKARVECVASTPTIPRRRRRRPNEFELAARLHKCEQLLRSHGIRLDDDDTDAPASTASPEETVLASIETPLKSHHPNPYEGLLISDNRDKTRFVENDLWTNLTGELALAPESSEDEFEDGDIYPPAEAFLLNHDAPRKNLSSLHPPPVHIFQLWQTFLKNVQPLTMVIHAPTVQQAILDASGNIKAIQKPMEALMFAIYFMAVTSLKEDECVAKFGQSRISLVSKYSHCVKQALINARLLKTLNLTTLQAFILCLLGIRNDCDARSFWILTGTAVRIGQRLGIHHNDSSRTISLFDAEMRRRVWWQLVFLEGHSSRFAGAGFPHWMGNYDTKAPLNVSDSDLTPTMTELPVEREGPTEMLFCSMRYEVAQTLRGTSLGLDNVVTWEHGSGPEAIPAKDKLLDNLEARLQARYRKYCDPSIPLHMVCLFMSSSVICQMRLSAHHPSQHPDKGANMSGKERDFIFANALKMLEFDTLGHTETLIEGFLWHLDVHHQLDAFIFLLSELRHRTTGDEVDRAWEQVRAAYTYRKEMTANPPNALYFAVGSLTLKSWSKREEVLNANMHHVTPPRYISILRAQRGPSECLPPPQQPPQPLPQSLLPQSSGYLPGAPYGTGLEPAGVLDYSPMRAGQEFHGMGLQPMPATDYAYDMTLPDVTPGEWEYWQTLMDGELPAYSTVTQQYITSQEY